MRHYQPDSPEAMARVVALALLADGGLDKTELDTLERLGVVGQLGMTNDEFDEVVHEFCDDLLAVSMRDASGQIALDRETIDSLLADIQSADKQLQLVRILLDLVNADGRVTTGEMVLVSQAMARWGLALAERPVTESLK